MKKINLIGMSVTTAALLMSGCGSSSSSSSSGDAVIKSMKQPTVINDETVASVMDLLGEEFGNLMMRKATKVTKNLKTVQEASFAMESGVPVESNCDVSGTETETYTFTDDENSYTEKYEYVYDNCVDSTTGSWGSIDGVPLNLRTRNGTETYTYSEGYDVDTNTSRDSYSGADNYTETYENNETAVVSRNNTYKTTASIATESTGDVPYYDSSLDGVEGAFVKVTYMFDGINEGNDVNTTGDIADSWKYVAENASMVEEALLDGSEGTQTLNGSWVDYENGTAIEGEYFDDFVIEGTNMGNEGTIMANGTIGNLCLDGSVAVKTTETMHVNQEDYFDDTNSTGDDVLPYAGNLNLTGEGSVADVAFSTNETNNTSATVTIGENEETYTSLSALTDASTCNIGPR